MKYVDVSDDFVNLIFRANNIKVSENKIEESTEVEAQETQVVEEAEEVHVCPLCESQLEEELSDSKLQECIDFILDTLNETTEDEGETLEESEEEEEETEEGK